MFLISTECQDSWHYHLPQPNGTLVGTVNCMTAETHNVLTLLSTTDTAAFFSGFEHEGSAGILYYLPRYWAPVWAATAQAHFGVGTALSYSDLYCRNCHTYVNSAIDAAHWNDICGNCSHHSDDCQCCSQCESSPCECCESCGNPPGWCGCCPYCSSPECECDTCENCGDSVHGCGCSSSSHGNGFGSSKTAPWAEREDAPYESTLPTISECQHNEIDPVMAAANFYLLDAVKNLVRLSNVTFATPEQADRFHRDRPRIVPSDNMLAALTTSAERTYRSTVDYLAPNFLAYSLSAVGGELRYHNAMTHKVLPNDRALAWNAFVGIVQTKGADVLFDADTLFREFGGGSYGGEKWGAAAKVVGQYLNGQMPAWLFVDRVFTLQHNGGCFLNKVTWTKRNRKNWGLTKMQYVLNAHAGKDVSGYDLPDNATDWRCLLALASPEVAAMFDMAEKNIRRIVRRYGGSLAPIGKSEILKALGTRSPSPW